MLINKEKAINVHVLVLSEIMKKEELAAGLHLSGASLAEILYYSLFHRVAFKK
jgi:hypothetical protein